MREERIPARLTDFVFDQSSLVVIVADHEGVIREASRYAEEFAGRSLAGVDLTDIVVDFGGEFDLERAALEGGTRLMTLCGAAGTPESFRFDVGECGDEFLLVGEILHDEHEALREHLLRLNGEVNDLNRELQRRAAELERLVELKSRFIGMAAHDLRNPIGGIRGMSDVLRQEAESAGDDARAEVFAMMHESSGFMLSLVEDLLTAVEFEAGRLHLNLETTDLNELIASTARLNQLLADRREVRLAIRSTTALPRMRLDRMKLHQVLNNLISNAVKFSPTGATVVISARSETGSVAISVADRGPGIPPEELPGLFTPFQRTSVRSPHGERGTGLGLSIAKGIVDAHGGRISVDTEVGNGSTFTVSLPVGGR